VKKWLRKFKLQKGVSYNFTYQILNCADYGVPQKRERVFLIANRVDVDFVFPVPTHADPISASVKNGLQRPYVTPAQAFSGIDYKRIDENVKVGGKWKDLLPCVPPGANYQYFTEKGDGPNLFEYRSRYWTFLLKLSPGQPSWTLQASPGSSTGPFH
jgi:DNA (cytosine-5)-methyltransferase 1